MSATEELAEFPFLGTVPKAIGQDHRLFGQAEEVKTDPAEKVAEAAQAFGREDDITVLTLKFAGAGVAVRDS